VLALDGIAIIVHPDCPVDDLSPDPISTSRIEALAMKLKKTYTIVAATHNMQQVLVSSGEASLRQLPALGSEIDRMKWSIESARLGLLLQQQPMVSDWCARAEGRPLIRVNNGGVQNDLVC